MINYIPTSFLSLEIGDLHANELLKIEVEEGKFHFKFPQGNIYLQTHESCGFVLSVDVIMYLF